LSEAAAFPLPVTLALRLMDKRSSSEKQLSVARQHLYIVLLDQRAAIEELQANNLELAAVLEEFLNGRADLRVVAGDNTDGRLHPHADGDRAAYGADGDGFAYLAKSAQHMADSKDMGLEQLQQEAGMAREAAQHAMQESVLLRLRSRRLRAALRDGFGENHKPEVTDHGGLSKRERQVLALIVAGKTSKQIAVELGISFKTAVTHRASIMGKLDVHEIASVVREAIRRGLA
jgi:DNA-binding CsgD family transcriptional regulator